MANHRGNGHQAGSGFAIPWTRKIDAEGFTACVQVEKFSDQSHLRVGWSATLPTTSANMVAATYEFGAFEGAKSTCRQINFPDGAQFASKDKVGVVASVVHSSAGGDDANPVGENV